MADFIPSLVRGEVSVSITEIQTNNQVLTFGSQAGVPSNTLTTVATIPANGLKYITQIYCTGNFSGLWRIYIDNNLKIEHRTVTRQVNFDFSTPLKLPASSVLDVKVIHYGDGTNTSADFNCSILGYAV